MFATICFTIHNLPPGSQAAICDVAEAYHTVPIISDQWLGLVVKLLGDDEFAINTCNSFGLSSAGGIYGKVADAALDIFRAKGIGPVLRWVDDHIFFCISGEHCTAYNIKCVISGTPPSIKMEVVICQAAKFGTKGNTYLMALPWNLMKMLLHQSQIILILQIVPNIILFSLIVKDIDFISEQLGIP